MNAKVRLPSVDKLHRCFEYEAVTGRLLWRHREDVGAHVNSRLAGKEAGSSNGRYRQVELNGWTFCVHRIVFKMHHGFEPEGDVDHRDTNTDNNCIENLRDCTHQENGRNSKASLRRSPGLKGTTYRKRDNRYYAQISIDKGKRKHLGSFATEAEAHAAYCEAAKQHFGAFARSA